MRPDQVWLELGQVDLDHFLVVRFRTHIGDHQIGVHIGKVGQIGAVGGAQISRHARVIREDGTSRTQFSAHVADRRLAGAAQRLGAFTEVFNDAVGAAFHSQNTEQLQNHILWRGPTG